MLYSELTNDSLMFYLDSNECLTDDNGGCDQICNNSIGKHTCSCYTGYSLELDEKTCSRML